MKPNYHQIDARLGVAEKSNRALLEEVVRLQSENKMILHHNDEVCMYMYSGALPYGHLTSKVTSPLYLLFFAVTNYCSQCKEWSR